MKVIQGCSAACDPTGTGFCAHAQADAAEWRAERYADREVEYDADDYDYESPDDVPQRWEL